MSKLRRRILFWFLILNISLLSASIIYGFVTAEALAEGREAVECVFKHNMKMYCPGCGGSRSLLYLLRFDIIDSFIYYPALPLMLLFVIDIDIRAFISFIKDSTAALSGFNKMSLVSIPILILLNFILKNVLLIGFGIDILGDILI